MSNIVLIFHFNDETKLQTENLDQTLPCVIWHKHQCASQFRFRQGKTMTGPSPLKILFLGNKGEDYGLTGLMAILAKIIGSKALRVAAIEGAKEVCKATGGMDYADTKKSWTDWAEEYLGDAGFILKKAAIAAAKLFCKSL